MALCGQWSFSLKRRMKTLKQKRWQPSSLQPFYKLLYGFYNAYRFVTIPAYRSRVISTLRFGNEHHQHSNFTQANRYPDLFEMAKSHFADKNSPKILSFGCSTGEEVASLADYVPHAQFIGVDINDWCVKQATKNYASSSRKFYHVLSGDFKFMTNFDAIFCLAVFQNPENRDDRTRTESAYKFEQFESQLTALNRKLKSGGLLFIDHCDFNFLETSLLAQYQIAPFKENKALRNRPLFNRKSLKVAERHNNFRVFLKK